MKLYKAFLKEEVMKKQGIQNPVIVVTEAELDTLIEGESIEKFNDLADPYKLYYSDLKMVISFDYKSE